MPSHTCQNCDKTFVYKARDVRHQPPCHRIVVGDSTRVEDVARAMGGQKATLMATDPPYLVDYQGGNHPQSWRNKPEARDQHWDDYHAGQACELFVQFLRVALDVALIPNPAVYQWHAYKRQALVESAWQQAGLLVHQQLIWLKCRAVLTHSHFMWQHEPCFYGWIEGDSRPGGRRRTSPLSGRSVRRGSKGCTPPRSHWRSSRGRSAITLNRGR